MLQGVLRKASKSRSTRLLIPNLRNLKIALERRRGCNISQSIQTFNANSFHTRAMENK